MRLRKPFGTAVVVAALGTGAGVGLGLGQAGGDDPAPLWRPPVTDVAVPATEAQKTAFSILATSPRPLVGDADRMLLERLATDAGIGVDVEGSRVVGATGDGPVWLVPVNGGLCLALEETAATAIGSACEPSGDVIARGTTIGNGTHIYGVAPDGVDAVTVTPSGEATSAVTVTEGGVYTLPSEDATVGVEGLNGVTEFDVSG
jgi:hypothetical protein